MRIVLPPRLRPALLLGAALLLLSTFTRIALALRADTAVPDVATLAQAFGRGEAHGRLHVGDAPRLDDDARPARRLAAVPRQGVAGVVEGRVVRGNDGPADRVS